MFLNPKPTTLKKSLVIIAILPLLFISIPLAQAQESISRKCVETLLEKADYLETTMTKGISEENKRFDLTYSVQRGDSRSWYKQTFEITDYKIGDKKNLIFDKSNNVPAYFVINKNSKDENTVDIVQFDNYGAMAFKVFPSVRDECSESLELVAEDDEYINPKTKKEGTDDVTIEHVTNVFYNLSEKTNKKEEASINVSNQHTENKKDISVPSSDYNLEASKNSPNTIKKLQSQYTKAIKDLSVYFGGDDIDIHSFNCYMDPYSNFIFFKTKYKKDKVYYNGKYYYDVMYEIQLKFTDVISVEKRSNSIYFNLNSNGFNRRAKPQGESWSEFVQNKTDFYITIKNTEKKEEAYEAFQYLVEHPYGKD
ncbi:MAG: hypothetical protein CMO82_06375 [Winogradskyella sp.]|nr:hypothetical protein [Winogradskyella sp.]